MEEKSHRLQPIGLTQGVSLQNVHMIMFREEETGRLAPLLISARESKTIGRAMYEHDFSTITLTLRLAHHFDIYLDYVKIHFSPKGAVSSILYFKSEREEKHITTNIADGVAAAINQQVPIVISEEDFNQRILRHQAEGRVSVPISEMTSDLLQEALKSAVEEENYELASIIRDEIRYRDTNNGDDEINPT